VLPEERAPTKKRKKSVNPQKAGEYRRVRFCAPAKKNRGNGFKA